MGKKILFLMAVLSGINTLYAQNPQTEQAGPLPFRQVSGIVMDSTEQVITGAIITLTSTKDTLRTTSNDDGLFFFKDVRSWEFTLSVSSLGYRTFVKIGKYNDSKPRLTLDPVILRTSYRLLDEVVVKSGPSIIYKTDTVEYRANDYIVREGANVAELLNKMHGMMVGEDGSLNYNGVEVRTAKLNGREFLAGDVPTVTKNLPAEIVEKVQIIDSYGDQAARTGIKDGTPEKQLNITTKADRSIGYFAKLSGGAGNDERYEGNVLGTKINANRNHTLSVSTSNTINGVPSGGVGIRTGQPGEGDSGGNTRKNGAIITYSDQWSRNTQVNVNYSYNSADINSLNSSLSRNFSTNGTTSSVNESTAINNSSLHTLKVELESDLDSANYIKVTPNFSYNSGNNQHTASAFLSGLIHQDLASVGTHINKTPNYGMTVLYLHTFRKKRRNYSLQLSGSNSNNESEREQNTNITYFDLLTDAILKDSLVRRLMERNNIVKNYHANFTYSEPAGEKGTLSIGAQINYNGYNNKTITSNVSVEGLPSSIDSLNNVFKYSFAQGKIGFRYQYHQKKYNLSAGFTGIPTVLSGESLSLGTSVRRASFHLLPIFRFQYLWNFEQSLTVNYSGAITEPRFDQVQAVRDVSDPQNIIVGNPGLKPALAHSITTNFRSYRPNSRFSIDVGLIAEIYNNRVITNSLQVEDAYHSLKYERHFVNLNGSYRIGGNYMISKAVSNRKYSFSLTGNVDRRYDAGMNNDQHISSRQWIFTQKLGSRMTPVVNLDINPSVSYSYSLSDYSLPGSADSKIKIWSLNLEGTYYSDHSWWIKYNTGKYFVSGINANLVDNPLIVNASFGIDILKNKTVGISLNAFDLFNQNKFLNRNITETGITDTRTNLNSRYFMGSLRFNLQRWKGTPVNRNGEPMKRRGDGSFIY